MKRLFGVLAVALLAAALALFGQSSAGPQQGQGPGNGPHAYCDKDGDGLCDFTGLPVGECRGQGDCPGCNGSCPRGQGQGQGRGQGRGPNGGACPRSGAAAQQRVAPR
jgi:hypothetical protein